MNADKFVVRGQTYDVLSPATFGDYIETVGAACINPLGYDENKLFLAYDDNVQKLFRATAAIAYSELLIKDTNCEPTTMAEALANALSAGGVSYDNTDSGLTASNVQDAIDEVNGDVETVNSDFTNQANGLTANAFANGAVNILENKGVAETVGTIAWVVNPNKSVTGNGTSAPSAGDYTYYYIIHDTSDEWLHLKAGVKYKFSCCPLGGSTDTYYVQFLYRTAVGTPSLSFGNDIGDGIEFTPSTDVICYIRVVVKKDVTLSNKEFRPMLTVDVPNSDYAHYVPYAMTNKELTDVAVQLKDGYIIEKSRQVLTVNTNGVKTHAQILNELATSLLAVVQALGDDEFIKINMLSIAGLGGVLMQQDSKFVKTTTSIAAYMGSTFTNNSSAQIRQAFFSNTASTYTVATFSSTTPTFTTYTNTVPASGANSSISYDVYKKIS